MSSSAAPRSLCIMSTFQCTAACKHCGTLSSPSEKTWLDPAVILHAIEQAPGAGSRLVVFTGGEPTLAGEHLLAGIRHAAERGLRVRLVTNADWARGRESEEQFVSRLVDAG